MKIKQIYIYNNETINITLFLSNFDLDRVYDDVERLHKFSILGKGFNLN